MADFKAILEDFKENHGGGFNSGKGRDVDFKLDLSLETVYFGGEQVFSIDGKEITVTIPKGIPNGYKMKLKGLGSPGVKEKGDLYLNVNILNASQFSREGDNLLLNVDLDYVTALLGGQVNVKTLAGKVLTVKVPPLTKSGTKMRIPKKGMPVFQKTEYGDLYITLNVQIPDKISDDEKELLSKIRDLRKK